MKKLGLVSLAVTCLLADYALAGEGKLLATPGLTQIEGSGGGGLVPWATIAGYDSREQTSASVFSTSVSVDDYRLSAWGANIGLYDRVELSVARHTFDLTSLGGDISQTIVGAKVRLYGDVIYSDWPQLALGVQHKQLSDGSVARLVGANNSSQGTDWYLSATKIHLGAAGGYNLVWNLTARATKANQMGLLGYGGSQDDDYAIMLEGSVGVLLSRSLVLGIEYRQKPDNLGLGEQDWYDAFISYLPNKHVNITAAWADLGSIAGVRGQRGLYLSITGYLW